MSSQPRIVTIGPLPAGGGQGLVAAVRFSGTFTPGVAVTELQFPDEAVQMVSPGIGYFSIELLTVDGGTWTRPELIRLTEQAVIAEQYSGGELRVALIPLEGCTLEAELVRAN